MPKNIAETTPTLSDCGPSILNARRLYLNSPPASAKNRSQVNPNPNDYNSDPIEICSIFWKLDITDRWPEQEETHPKYADLSNVACDIVSILPHGLKVGDSFSLGQDVISWRQSITAGETYSEKVVQRHFPQATYGILAGDNPALGTTETENNFQSFREVAERTSHIMANVHDILEMWQGSQNLSATYKESPAQNKQMTAVGYMSDM